MDSELYHCVKRIPWSAIMSMCPYSCVGCP